MRIDTKGVATCVMTKEQLADDFLAVWQEIGGISAVCEFDDNHGDIILMIPEHPKGAEYGAVAFLRGE
jgi:hypothetical protein